MHWPMHNRSLGLIRVIVLLIILITSINGGFLRADIIHVPGDYNDILTGILMASDGDTVLVADGVYTGNRNRDLTIYGWSFVLMSENGPENTIIDCEGSPSSPHRAFKFSASAVNFITIDGFTIRNGYAPSNSGIGNTESAGGAMAGVSSNHVIKNCIFENNACQQRGGAVYYSDGSPKFINCVFKNNISDVDGGAVYLHSPTPAEFSNCLFDENSAPRGGALYSLGSSSVFDHCLFSNNSAQLQGGAGVIWTSTSPDSLAFINCTFYGNSTEGFGGALYSNESYLTLDNCIIAFCAEGVAIGCESVVSDYPQLGCCDIYGNAGGDFVGCIAGFENQQGNFSLDPLFCEPDKGNFHIGRLSPCHPDSSICGLIGAYTPGCYEGPFPVADNINYGNPELGDVVTTPTPEIFWSYYDTSATVQAMYEIEVGSDDDWSVAEMWSSGPTASTDTSVIYGGAELENHKLYYLRLRLSDGSDWGGWNSSEFITHFDNIVRVPADYLTIQDGINFAIEGDTVLIADGIYTGDGNRDIELLGKAITVKSENGPEETIIDCQASPSDRHRGFYFHAFEDSTTIIEGLTITGGYAPPENSVYHLNAGGGIYCYHSSPTFSNCYIRYNHSTAPEDSIFGHGGGVLCQEGSPKFLDCDISYNYGDPSGGMQFDGDCNPKFINCTITNNDMDGINGGFVEMDNCLVENNVRNGLECRGGIFNECTIRGNGSGMTSMFDRLDMTDCIFLDNEEDGLHLMGSEYNYALAMITSTVFRGNGGDAISGSFTSFYFTSCDIVKNKKTAFAIVYCNLDLIGCTVVDNCCGLQGMGYYPMSLAFVDLGITRSIIAFNRGYELFYCAGGDLFISCTDVFGNSPGNWTGCIGAFADTLNNISQDPIFCDTALADYGLTFRSPCTAENSPCSNQIGAHGLGCSFEFPVALSINYGPEAHGYIISDPTPEICWSYSDTTELPQTAYQIQVGSDENWDAAEMWDSGPIDSGDTSTVYGGAALEDHETYYLRMRVANSRQWGSWNEIPLLAGLTNIVYVPSQSSTIQAGVDYAFDWDTILVAPGTYLGDGNRDIDFNGKSLAIIGTGGPDSTIIDCQGHAGIPHRAFYLNNNEDTTTTIEGFTIQNAYSGYGSAVFCRESNLKIKKCLFVKNGSEDGEIVVIDNGIMEISDCTFADNICGGEWTNAILGKYSSSTLTLESSIIAHNSAYDLYCHRTESVSLSCCDIYGNEFGDWSDCIADQQHVRNNFSQDPLFCDLSSGDYSLHENSPCIMTKRPCSPIIGALGVGCETGWICGDANDDGLVNVSDAVYIINYVFIGGPAPQPVASADANCDTVVNVSDAVRIINYVFIGGYDPCDLNGDGIPDC